MRFRQGTLSAAQVEAWLRFRPPSGRLDPEEARRRRIEERVLLEVLDRRFSQLGLESDLEARSWQRLLERRLAAAALRRAVNEETVAPAEEIEAAFRADPHRFDGERRFKLQNLFKRFPPAAGEEERERLRHEMAALREQLVAGAEFASLVRQESESATRERGGSMGSVALADLQPEVARVVATLGAGELSPVIETADGLTLLRCTGIVPEARLTPEEVRQRLAREIRRERVERAWDELTTRLLAELAPMYPLAPLGAAPESVVATARRGDGVETLDRRDLELFLREQRSAPPAALAPEELRRHAEELVLQLARSREAERRGLTTTPVYRERLAFETLTMRAELALAPEVRKRLVTSTEAEITALYERRKEQLAEPAQSRLRVLEIPIRSDLPAALYQHARETGARLEAGEITLEQAQTALAPHARLQDLGWLSQPAVWQLGRNVEIALQKLHPGGHTGMVQEGRKLMALQLVDHRDERPLTLAEARPSLVAALTAAQRERIRTELRAAIIAEQEIRFGP